MKVERFERHGSIWIERRVNREGPEITYTVWKPGTSVIFADKDRKAMIKWIAWPKSTPTGVAIREWLASFDAPKETPAPVEEPAIVHEKQEVVITPGSWDPASYEQEEEPNDNTKMVT